MSSPRRLRTARVAALGAVALVAALAVVVAARRTHLPATAPTVLVPAGRSWLDAEAGPLPQGTAITGCGLAVGPRTLAITHPVLPCGLRVIVDFGGRTVSVQVAGRATPAPNVTIGVSAALAVALGVTGAVPVRWAIASP